MGELLDVLRRWLRFFFAVDKYRLVHSQVGQAFDDALIEFTSETLRWRLVSDRAQIFLDCHSAIEELKESDWYSSDLLIRLLTGERQESAVLTKGMARWIQTNLAEIESRFAGERLESTKRELEQLKKVRAKELFG